MFKLLSAAVLAIAVTGVAFVASPAKAAVNGVSCEMLARAAGVPVKNIEKCVGGSGNWYRVCTIYGRNFMVYSYTDPQGNTMRYAYESSGGSC